jgi:hypothetical protein
MVACSLLFRLREEFGIDTDNCFFSLFWTLGSGRYSRLRRIAAGAVPIDLPRGFELFEKLLRV